MGVRVLPLEDPSRPTPARGPDAAHAGRSLPTTVFYPVAGAASLADHPGAAPLHGSFPLVAFAHGFNVTPGTYEDLLHALAAAGYVVAAPLFPISASGLPGPAREDDLYQQPGDMSFVISSLQRAGGPGGWLSGSLDPSLVAAVGQSDGGETVAGMLLIPADRDPRVRVAVILAGQIPTWAGFAPTSVPVLLEQGTADTINPPYLSEQLWGDLPPPKAYLTVYGYGHLPSVLGGLPGPVTVRDTVVAFLDDVLLRRPGAARQFLRYGDTPGVTSLQLVPASGLLW